MSILKYCTVVVLMFACLSVIFPQQKGKPAIFSHPLMVDAHQCFPAKGTVSIPETTHVLAVMVAFQEDADDRTTGTGSFDFSTSPSRIIDPPPRNRSYFANHLTFVENYFRKVSDGQRIIQPTLLDSVYRLSHQMQYYSPPRGSTVNREVGLLMEDAWHLVDSLSPGIPFDQYDAFIIFHAGTGRDIDFVSIYGYDPTPFDIPSLYLNLPGLKKMFGNSYDGVPVMNGTYRIQNSMVIPETENHTVSGIGGSSLLELGINGLMAANFGSHFGLPDLFDTKTGVTGIGRFGLMDGQSIFSWNGVFPPEPSAWEKYFLGWIQPVTISAGDTIHRFPAVSLLNNQDSIYKILISANEYFLVENRNRDANRDGSGITLVRNGTTVTKNWQRDTTGFNAVRQDSLYGVVIDVDEFDWSLPGFVNSRTHELFDGGILIWHIDENVINANIAGDAVNANPARKGVNLMEADGSQDIGQTYGFLSPGSGSENGTPIDFWYQGNMAPLRVKSNEFSPTSIPSSRSYDQANSHITITEFSPRGPHMTARIQVGDDQVKPLPGFPRTITGTIGNNSITATEQLGANVPALLVATDQIFAWKYDGASLDGFASSGLFARFPFAAGGRFVGKPSVADLDGNSVNDIMLGGNFRIINDPAPTPHVNAWLTQDIIPNDSLADILFTMNVSGAFVTSSLILGDTISAVGTQRNGVAFILRDGTVKPSVQFGSDTTAIVGLSFWAKPDTFIAVSAGGTVAVLTPLGIITTKNFGRFLNSSAASAIISSSIGKRIAFTTIDGYVYLLDGNLNIQNSFPVSTGGEILNSPAIADMNGDGQKDILVFSGNRIYAINVAGSVLDNFPVTVQTNKTIETSPIAADIDGNGTVDVVAVTQEGLVVAYDKTGKMAGGFPLQAGANRGSTPAAFPIVNRLCLSCDIGVGLAVASDDGHVYAWQTGSVSSMVIANPPQFQWPQYLHDAQNTGLDELSTLLTPRSAEFFPASLAYNWPNPVGKEHAYKTHIRYFVGKEARVHIRIFDMAGDLVAEFDGPGQAGLDNEIEWDVSGIQSGIYFAHIDAQGTNGSGNAVIKIAVIK